MAGMAGLNIGALPMNPALVAAALNQAGWSLMGNLQQGGQGGPAGGPGAEHAPFPTPTSFPATVTPGGPGQPHAGVTTMASSAPQGNGSAGFLGWGASPPGERGVTPRSRPDPWHPGEQVPGASQPSAAPPNGAAAAAAAGTWSNQPRDRQGAPMITCPPSTSGLQEEDGSTTCRLRPTSQTPPDRHHRMIGNAPALNLLHPF